MKIAAIQLLVEGAEPQRNIERTLKFIQEAIPNKPDLILLPETLDFGWTHPFSKSNAEPIPGKFSDVFCDVAAKNNVWICVGLTEREGEKLYNSAILINRLGKVVLKHRKINLLQVEFPFYEVGKKLEVVETEFGNVGLTICADNYYQANYIGNTIAALGAQIVLSPSSWTVTHQISENQNPYADKWLKPYLTLAQNHQLIIASTTSVGYIVGGPYVGKKMVGQSLIVGPNGIIAQGAYNEFATDVFYARIKSLQNPYKGEQIGNYLKTANNAS